MTELNVRQPPLYSRVIFVDWHGVLSRDPFGSSIRSRPRHPMRQMMEDRVSQVLADDRLASLWMTGALSTEEVLRPVQVRAPRRYRDDFLMRRVLEDCRKMTVGTEMTAVLEHVRLDAAVVVATDNMDCFSTAFRGVKRRGPASATMAGRMYLFDDFLCSSDVGVLKSEAPERFFGGWLRRAELGFADALLIDDRADNCAAFRRCGGVAVQWRIGDGVEQLSRAVDAWLRRPVLAAS